MKDTIERVYVSLEGTNINDQNRLFIKLKRHFIKSGLPISMGGIPNFINCGPFTDDIFLKISFDSASGCMTDCLCFSQNVQKFISLELFTSSLTERNGLLYYKLHDLTATDTPLGTVFKSSNPRQFENFRDDFTEICANCGYTLRYGHKYYDDYSCHFEPKSIVSPVKKLEKPRRFNLS